MNNNKPPHPSNSAVITASASATALYPAPTLSTWRLWLYAVRLRTLPLSVASVATGHILAAHYGLFSWTIALLSLITAILLQISGNLANDYGDASHHVDGVNRVGPPRMTASGAIRPRAMLVGTIVACCASVITGLILLAVALTAPSGQQIWLWLTLGAACIMAALAYTMGQKPYGYRGGGDVAVLLFFGYVAVGGTFYLQTATFAPWVLWPATTLGLWCVAVLNVNNMRDADSDQACGKHTLAVRLGQRWARYYHAALLLLALSCWAVYLSTSFTPRTMAILLLGAIWMSGRHLHRIWHRNQAQVLNRELQNLSLGILLQVVLYGFITLLLPGA